MDGREEVTIVAGPSDGLIEPSAIDIDTVRFCAEGCGIDESMRVSAQWIIRFFQARGAWGRFSIKELKQFCSGKNHRFTGFNGLTAKDLVRLDCTDYAANGTVHAHVTSLFVLECIPPPGDPS